MNRDHRVLLLLLLAMALTGSGGAAQAPSARAGEVTALLPVASVHRGGAAPAPVAVGAEVLWQDLLETQPRARARVALLDGSVLNVGSGVKLLIARHDAQSEQTELELTLGKVRAQVRKLTQPSSSFVLRTNTAVVGVIGTHVYVDAQTDATTVINLDTGSSRVRSSEAAITEEQILEPFEVTIVARGQAPTPKRRATIEEILGAILETLPGLTLPLGPGTLRAGSCTQLLAGERLLATRQPFLELKPGACGGGTSAQVCVPEDAEPGLYEFALPTAAGERLSAFLVRPAEPPHDLSGARLYFAPEAPPGSVHYARLLDDQNHPLEGIPVRIKTQGEEKVLHTDASGGFAVPVPESGAVEIGVETSTRATLIGAGPAPTPITGRIQAVHLPDARLPLPAGVQRGSVVNLPGEVTDVRLGDRKTAVTRTVTRAGRTISTVAVPVDFPEGRADLVWKDATGRDLQRPLLVFEVLSGRLENPALTSGTQTRGEFVLCVGDARRKKVRAQIVAAGPVQFEGKGARGKMFEQELAVEAGGQVRIPFQIRADKGAPGAGVPFSLRLTLTR